MEVSYSETIVVKTFETGEHNGFALIEDCLFAVDRKEWEEIGRYLKPNSESSTDDYPHYIIRLWDLYHTARVRIVEKDDKLIDFLMDYGNKKALYHLRKGIRVAKNITRISSVFDELTLFHKLQIESDFDVDPVSNNKLDPDIRFEKYWLIEKWQLPMSETDVEKCKVSNEPLVKKAIEDFTCLLQFILSAKYLCCIINCNGLKFKIRFVEGTCPWNPQIRIQLFFKSEEKETKKLLKNTGPDTLNLLRVNAKAGSTISLDELCAKIKPMELKDSIFQWNNPARFGKVTCNLKYFMETFLPSLTRENYKGKLEEVFPLF